MLTTAPHLRVRRPSPTTAEFTVTTCPPRTLSVRVLLGFVFVLRVLLGLSVLLLLHSSWTVPQQQQQHYGSIGSGGVGQGQQQLLSNATVAIKGGSSNGGGGRTTVLVATTATSSSVYEGYHDRDDNSNNNNDQEQQQYEKVHPVDHAAIELVATTHESSSSLSSSSLDNTQQQQQRLLVQRPNTLYTTAWAAYLLQQLHASPPGELITTLAQQTLPPSLIFPLSLLLLYLTTQRIHTTESLLVLRGLGIQTSSTGGNYLQHWPFFGLGGAQGASNGKTRFIPTEKIRDVLINEAFRGFGVRYYLVVVVDGEEDVVVVFPGLLPRRAIVERVWRGVRGCLWEPQDGVGGGSLGGGASSSGSGSGGVAKRVEDIKTSSRA